LALGSFRSSVWRGLLSGLSNEELEPLRDFEIVNQDLYFLYPAIAML
jgi:hypothetical protein